MAGTKQPGAKAAIKALKKAQKKALKGAPTSGAGGTSSPAPASSGGGDQTPITPAGAGGAGATVTPQAPPSSPLGKALGDSPRGRPAPVRGPLPRGDYRRGSTPVNKGPGLDSGVLRSRS